jgi:hypothetical protein
MVPSYMTIKTETMKGNLKNSILGVQATWGSETRCKGSGARRVNY